MASAQVLPNSSTASARKQEHLHKGKSLLEEFRKKKAAGKAKKAAPINQVHIDGVVPEAKQPLECERVRHTNTDGDAVSSSGSGRLSGETINKDENRTDVNKNNGIVISNEGRNSPHPTNESKAVSAVEMQSLQTNAKDNPYGVSGYNGSSKIDINKQNKFINDGFEISSRSQGSLSYEIPDPPFSFGSQLVREFNGSSSQSIYSGTEESHLTTSSLLKDAEIDSGHSHTDSRRVSNESLGKNTLENKSEYNSTLPNGHISSSYEGVHNSTLGKEFDSDVGHKMHDHILFKDQVRSDSGGENNSSFDGQLHNARTGTSSNSDYLSTSFNFNVPSPFHPEPLFPATAEHKSRRSRPTFLDSLNMSKAALPAPSSTEPKKDGLFMPDSYASYDTSSMGPYTSQNPLEETKMEEQQISKFGNLSMPSAFEHPMASSFSSGIGTDMLRWNNDDGSHKYRSSKQHEDFASLEQHIEDLTQEKFSLQRAVESSRALAESLAAENSSLTESYNQQGGFVNQLKSEMESLQQEIKAQLDELESVKMEYGNVLLECNAADERGKLLASEVIGLEEKALRLRSNELKLERQLENSYAEMASYKKKLSSLEKDRQDLQSTINALQEEKKLLQDKLRKASVSGKSINVSKTPTEKKDTSTSTEDLVPMADASNLDVHNSAAVLHDDASSSTLLAENREFNVEVSSANIPPDQTAMIQNIDLLISEITFEKEELIKALAAESSQSSMLKDLNKELSRKLETQTQRLELLTAQSMANGNISTRQSLDTQNMHDNSAYVDKGLPTYADEGDEVVERVLGWIMKLFPGGPSKRRTSKLL